MPIHSLFLVYDCARGNYYDIRYIRIDRNSICATKREAMQSAWLTINSDLQEEDTVQILHLSDFNCIWHHADVFTAIPDFEKDREIQWTIRKDGDNARL